MKFQKTIIDQDLKKFDQVVSAFLNSQDGNIIAVDYNTQIIPIQSAPVPNIPGLQLNQANQVQMNFLTFFIAYIQYHVDQVPAENNGSLIIEKRS
jgi:hypothetical protein